MAEPEQKSLFKNNEMEIFKTFFNEIKSTFYHLPLWVKRLIIVGTIVSPLMTYNYHKDFEDQLEKISITIIIYWILVLLGFWVYAGVERKQNKEEDMQHLKVINDIIEVMKGMGQRMDDNDESITAIVEEIVELKGRIEDLENN